MRSGGQARRRGDEKAVPKLAAWTASTRRSALQDMLVATAGDDVISLALGLPAPELFPADALRDAVTATLAADPRALQYGPPSEALRGHVVELMRRRGVRCRREQVFLTSGAQQGMALVARLLVDQGGTVAADEYCYTGFQQVLDPLEARVLPLSCDPESGTSVDDLERLLASGARPSLVYVVAEGHNPTGASMPVAARERLAELAREHEVVLLEDDPYGFLQYDGELRPPVRAFDDRWVVYVGTFSKIVAPALRAGWVVAPDELVPHLAILKEAADIDMATLAHRALARLLDEISIDDHIATLRRAYAAKRDLLLGALAREMPEGATWNRPRSGLFAWLELPDGVDALALARLAVERERVATIPGAAFRVPASDRPCRALRLNFSHAAPEAIAEAVARLARAARAAMEETG